MQRSLLLTLVIAVLASACNSTPPPPTSPVRTPVPTWTLPFKATDASSAPSTPGAETTPVPGPDFSATPTSGFSPTPSPTARPGIDPTLGAATPDPFITPAIPIPEPMPQLRLDKDIVNVLLLGRDTARDSNSYRTDVIIVVSINKKANAVTMLTIPRDLYLYIPGWTMNRINTASFHGDAIGYPGGGVALLEQTILYNLGLPIHGWARIDFGGFKDVVDILGGVDIPVSCEMTDWRLKDPSLDQQNPDNWELYTVTTGVQHMDGDLALWYARSRKHSSDFDRSRRQHQVLRAMFDKGLQLDALTKAPELYNQYVNIVDTDMGLGDVLQFIPVAAQMDRARIKSRFIGLNQVYRWTTPEGAAVLLPDREAIAQLVDEAFRPPSENVLAREAPSVEIWNGTPNGDWAALAADNLAWDGIQPVIGQADATNYATTVIYDYTTSPKGSARPELQRIFHVSDENVIAAPDASAQSPFRVILGADYASCVAPVRVALGTPTPFAPPPVPEGEIVHAAGITGQPPRVDGDLSEWTNLAYAIDQPTFGRENWKGADDLSARWNIAWDQQYLYIALKVKDDVFVRSEPATGANLFRGDSLEILLDIDPGSREKDILTDRDFQLGISPGNLAQPPATAEAYLWLPEDEARGIGGVSLAAKLAPGGYEMEIAVPWQIFRVAPFAGEGFAFTLTLDDDDTPGSAEQESQVSSTKDRKLIDPFTWGLLVLDTPPGP